MSGRDLSESGLPGLDVGTDFEAIALPDADVRLAACWLDADRADTLFAALLQQVDWEQHRVRLFGREHDAPRLSFWIGDPGAQYSYSGSRFQPHPWPPSLAALRPRLAELCDAPFNSVLVNLYRNGADAMGWHSDDEPELGAEPVIASLSLGAVRRFAFKRREPGVRSIGLELPHGSVLRMAGRTQNNYRHALPRTRRPVGPRINLTFRRIRSA